MSDQIDFYKNVPDEQKDAFFKFRDSHPYKETEIDDKVWRYISCGQGAKTLMLLPGGFMKADMWYHTIVCFEESYRIIAPDNYALQDTFDMDAVCRAHAAILDAEGVEKATVIGVSGGAGVAQFFLQQYPQKVDNIVISHCGVVKPGNYRRLRKKLSIIKALPYFVTRAILKKTVHSHWEYPSSSAWVEFRNAYLRETGSLMTKHIFLKFMEEGARAHRDFIFDPSVVRNFPGKILILSSKGDSWTAANEAELKERYPGAEVCVFEEGGHHTLLLFPEEYNRVIRAFLENTCS